MQEALPLGDLAGATLTRGVRSLAGRGDSAPTPRRCRAATRGRSRTPARGLDAVSRRRARPAASAIARVLPSSIARSRRWRCCSPIKKADGASRRAARGGRGRSGDCPSNSVRRLVDKPACGAARRRPAWRSGARPEPAPPTHRRSSARLTAPLVVTGLARSRTVRSTRPNRPTVSVLVYAPYSPRRRSASAAM